MQAPGQPKSRSFQQQPREKKPLWPLGFSLSFVTRSPASYTSRPSWSFVVRWLQMSPEHLFLLLVTSMSSLEDAETQMMRVGCGPIGLSSPECLKSAVSAFPHVLCGLPAHVGLLGICRSLVMSLLVW